jgi:hypothetical protein
VTEDNQRVDIVPPQMPVYRLLIALLRASPQAKVSEYAGVVMFTTPGHVGYNSKTETRHLWAWPEDEAETEENIQTVC